MNIKSRFWTRPFLIDLGGVLFFLFLGGVGIVAMVAPHWVFPAFMPMLTPRDWPVATDQPEMILYTKHFEQQQGHVYFLTQVEESSGARASIRQEVSWYADTDRTKHQWQIDVADAAARPYTTTFPAVTQPAHLFSCHYLDEDNRSCTYYAYAGHWYVLVRFFSNDGTRLTLAQMEQLAGLVGERLAATAVSPPSPQ